MIPNNPADVVAWAIAKTYHKMADGRYRAYSHGGNPVDALAACPFSPYHNPVNNWWQMGGDHTVGVRADGKAGWSVYTPSGHVHINENTEAEAQEFAARLNRLRLEPVGPFVEVSSYWSSGD